MKYYSSHGCTVFAYNKYILLVYIQLVKKFDDLKQKMAPEIRDCVAPSILNNTFKCVKSVLAADLIP